MPEGRKQSLIEPWPKKAEKLLNDDSFGDLYASKKATKLVTENIPPVTATFDNKKEQAKAIYEWINQNLDWNENYHFVGSTSTKKLLEEGRGNTADLNLLLVAALRAAGIDAHPVLVRHRDSGRNITSYPNLGQFDSVVALADLDGTLTYMELRGMTTPFDMLLRNSLNYEGLKIAPTPEWVKLKPGKSSSTVLVKARLEGDELAIDWAGSYDDYAAFRRRNFLLVGDEHTEEEYQEEYLQEELPEAEIESLELDGLDDFSGRLKEKAVLTAADAITDAGDLVYINPVLANILEENPFSEETRLLPIEFPYPSKSRYIFTLEIPEGYEVESLPEPVAMRAGDYGVKYTYEAKVVGTKISVNVTTEVTGLLLPAEAYEAIRKMFDLMVEKQGEMVVLKRV